MAVDGEEEGLRVSESYGGYGMRWAAGFGALWDSLARAPATSPAPSLVVMGLGEEDRNLSRLLAFGDGIW
jgi:hypothetical protein